MSKVYIVQEPLKKDFNTGQMIPIMDFRSVLEYGDPVVLLQSGRVSLTPGPTIDAIREGLRDFTDDDYIVSVGDPSAIFITAMIAGEVNSGKCKLLKWDKVVKRYVCINIDLNFRRKQN
jgi:hypothetical protein